MVREAHLLHVKLPFRRKFKHALYKRTQSDSIFLKLQIKDGPCGFGESLPREYVTGETTSSVMVDLQGVLQREVVGYIAYKYSDLLPFIEALHVKGMAARCAVELALLDAYGKYFNAPVSSVIGNKVNNSIHYSGVIQAGSVRDAAKKAFLFKIFGLNTVKVKVGAAGDDLARLAVVRNILGRHADIRIDANCVWNADEAISKINMMRRYRISAVEQPVGKNNFEGLKKVTESIPEAVIADESLCTIDDAKRLADTRACNIFNIRLSKCGGIINSIRIADVAHKSGIGVQLGCQVGESGILSAAGWHFASALLGISFYEGAYGKFLLKEDITKEDLTIHRGGIIQDIAGPGLGVEVSEKALRKYLISENVVAR